MIESYLIKHCAPTLAKLKTAGLFSFSYYSEEELKQQINSCNTMLNPKGVYIFVLHKNNHKSLIYVYRKKNLIKDINKKGVKEFIQNCGYENTDVNYLLNHLSSRFSKDNQFPHEIGLFLGYPLKDVTGFIENSGKNSKLCGYWKVYDNVAYAADLFGKYSKCRKVYEKLYKQGTSIQKLTVAA